MSLYTLFEMLLYLVAATLLGFGIGWVVRSGRAALRPPGVEPDEHAPRLRRERDAARAQVAEVQARLTEAQGQVAERRVELDAVISELTALKRSSMTQRFLPDGPVDLGELGDEPSPAGTLDSWPPPDEVEALDEQSREVASQLQVMVTHLRAKLFESTRENQRLVESREALVVELKGVRKARDAQLDVDARLQVELAERDAAIQSLRERLDAASREIDSDMEQVSRLDDRLAAALAQVEDLEGEVRAVTDERDNREERAEALEAELATVRRKLDSWDARRADLEHAFDAFRAMLTSAESGAEPAPSGDSEASEPG